MDVTTERVLDSRIRRASVGAFFTFNVPEFGGFTIPELIAWNMSDAGTFSSDHGTVNNGESHRTIDDGSSYR